MPSRNSNFNNLDYVYKLQKVKDACCIGGTGPTHTGLGIHGVVVNCSFNIYMPTNPLLIYMFLSIS